MTAHNIRRVVLDVVSHAAERGQSKLDLTDNLDLVGSGIYDSMSFLDAIGEIEGRLGMEVDLADLDPDEYTRLGGLVKAFEMSFVAKP
jgi:acyl carrier protein